MLNIAAVSLPVCSGVQSAFHRYPIEQHKHHVRETGACILTPNSEAKK